MITQQIRQSKSYTLSERLAYVSQWRQSKITRLAFCNQQGLNFRSFEYWVTQSKKLSLSSPQEELTNSFIKLKPLTPLLKSKQESSLIKLYYPNGIIIELLSNSSMELISNLIQIFHK